MDAKAVATFAVAAVVLVSMVSMASADSQTWYLDSDDRFTEISNDYYMWKGNTANCSGSVGFPLVTGERIWIADEPAECDVTFPAGTWNGSLYCSAGVSVTLTGTYEIGVYNTTTQLFTAKGTTSIPLTLQLITPTTHPFTITTDQAFTVNEGEYLAFRFTIDIGVSLSAIQTDGSSWIESPSSDPGYPIPELSTIALFSTGLLALAGFVVYRRKRRDL